MSLILGALGGLGEGMMNVGAQMAKDSSQRDRDEALSKLEFEKLKVIEAMREKQEVAKEGRAEDLKNRNLATYQKQYDQSSDMAKAKLTKNEADALTAKGSSYDTIDPATGQPGQFAGQSVSPDDVAAMPPAARAIYEKQGLIPKRTDSLILSAQSEAARSIGAMPELRKELDVGAKDAASIEANQRRLEQADVNQARLQARDEQRHQEVIARMGGAAKEIDQGKIDNISQGAHRIAANLADGMKDPFADPMDKDSKDHLAKNLLSSYLSKGVVNAAMNNSKINPDEAGAQLLAKIKEADAIVRKQGTEQARKLFEGKEPILFGKNGQDKDAIEALKKSGFPESALASPVAFQKFYREQHLEETFLKVVSDTRGGKPADKEKPADAPKVEAKKAEPAKQVEVPKAAKAPEDIGLTGLTSLAIQRIANDPNHPKQKMAQEHIMKQSADRRDAQALRVNDDQFNPEYYK